MDQTFNKTPLALDTAYRGAGDPSINATEHNQPRMLPKYPDAAHWDVPVRYRGGLPGCRLRRVLDYIAKNVTDDLSLVRLAAVAGMSSHYFAELFRLSTGIAPHRYVLLQRIERAKQSLRDPRCSIMDAGLDAGFQNPSHFARIFRKFVGTSPSDFQGDLASRQYYESASR